MIKWGLSLGFKDERQKYVVFSIAKKKKKQLPKFHTFLIGNG